MPPIPGILILKHSPFKQFWLHPYFLKTDWSSGMVKRGLEFVARGGGQSLAAFWGHESGLHCIDLLLYTALQIQYKYKKIQIQMQYAKYKCNTNEHLTSKPCMILCSTGLAPPHGPASHCLCIWCCCIAYLALCTGYCMTGIVLRLILYTWYCTQAKWSLVSMCIWYCARGE